MLTKQYYVYFLTNWNNKVLYVGVTNDLKRRIYEHKNGLVEGFTRKYHVHKLVRLQLSKVESVAGDTSVSFTQEKLVAGALVYYEVCEDIEGAILREKQIKSGSRQKKNDLVSKFNPDWEDLLDRL